MGIVKGRKACWDFMVITRYGMASLHDKALGMAWYGLDLRAFGSIVEHRQRG